MAPMHVHVVMEDRSCSVCLIVHNVPMVVLSVPPEWREEASPAAVDALQRHRVFDRDALNVRAFMGLVDMLSSFGSRDVPHTLVSKAYSP